MRQTSRAVALLLTLESAQAGTRPIVVNLPAPNAGLFTNSFFNPAAATVVTASVQLNSRTAAYSNKIPNAIFASTQTTGPQWLAATYHKAKAGASAPAVTFTVGSKCIACLGSTGVWCSRTYAYLETGATYNSQVATALGTMSTLSTTDPGQIGGAALDQGACCESATAFSTFIGTLAVQGATFTDNATATAITPGYTMVATACPAVQLGAWTDGGAAAPNWGNDAKLDDLATNTYSSWWCSNGLYKTVTANTVVELNSQQIMLTGMNKRTELAMVGCPQSATACGNTGSSIAKLIASADVAATTFKVALTGFSVNDKCSWVVYAVDAAPTFVMNNSTLTGAFGLASANWQIHHMEYTANTSWSLGQSSLMITPTTATSGYIQTGPGLARDSMLPLFTMPAAQFQALRTWYGQGSTAIDDKTGMSSNWSTAGQAPIVNTTAVSLQLAAVKSQLYGNVANVPVSGNVIQASGTTALTATQNYGKYNGIEFDLRAMRYFPAMVAQTVWTAGSSLSTQYSTALASYNTAKTTWDAYVAILDKNAKQDAFAALFSPPKAPTVPPLPNMPWVPAAYSGYVRATAIQTKAYAAGSTVGTTVASPTAQEFWTSLAAAQTVGGWGSFTATIFTFRNGWGKSFGTIGYSGDADNQSMSDVWNYTWTCAQSSATSQPTSQCESSFTAVAGSAGVASTATSANAVKMVTVVSLWATSNTNTANAAITTIPTLYDWATNGFQITFTASPWKSGIVGLTPLTANTAPDLAKSLSGIAGAQALAATSAAALAVAAALY